MNYDTSNVDKNDDKAIRALYSCKNWEQLMIAHSWIQKAKVTTQLKEQSFSWCIRINNQRGYK